MTTVLHCLRCQDLPLRELPGSPHEITFYACPGCERQYARERGGPLQYRWRHPLTLALYPVIFEASPAPLAPRVASSFRADWPEEKIEAMVREIRLELDDPTVSVRAQMDCRASEEDLREYLRRLTSCLESENAS